MNRRLRLPLVLYGAAGVAFLLDRSSKWVAERYLAGRPPVRLIPDIVHLTYTTNSGGAFGLLADQPWLFFWASVLICLAIVVASTRLSSPASAAGLGLILGGALGNLTDRILRGPDLSGRVIDFIDLRVWPVFNLADSAILIGAAVVVLAGLRRTA